MPPWKLLREPEISEDNVPVAADEDVLRFEVAVDDARGVQALDALDNFRRVEPGAVTPEPAPSRELGREVASRVKVLFVAGQLPISTILIYTSPQTYHD